MTFREFGAVVEGYKRREDQEWRRSRMVGYITYRANSTNPEPIERWMPLRGDPVPDINKFKRDAKRLNDKAKVLWPM